MATNQSVKQFQALLSQLPPAVKGPLRAEIFSQAHELRNAMLFAVPVGGTRGKLGAGREGGGALRDSIRVETSDRSDMRALVRAGGPTTTVRGYDYALAQEFGTSKTRAQPFFWPTYRAKKKAIRKAIKDAAKAAIGTVVPLK
jgi:HK97 gp10 family phage protein